MHSRTTLSLVTLVAATNTAGCYSTWDIAPHALLKLDGFRVGHTVKLPTRESDYVDFDADSTVHFEGSDGVEADAQFSSIEIRGPVLFGSTLPNRMELKVDLQRLSKVQVRNNSPPKTALLTTGAVLGAISGTIGGALWLYVSYYTASGRPLRLPDQKAPVRAPLGFSRAPRRTPEHCADELTRARLFAHWAREASAECASIPAFLALARDLARASAPRNLVDAALRAAREEATHTRLCTALANDHADVPIAACTPPTPQAADANAQGLLERLVVEAFWDGCVAEGSAAAMARRAAVIAKNDTARTALNVIMRDEQGHADLARDILAFGLSVGGDSLRRVLGESFEQRRAEEEARLNAWTAASTMDFADEDMLREHGLASNDMQHQARIETWEKSVSMLEALGCV